jgi:fibronectin type 3 domain-containing protein
MLGARTLMRTVVRPLSLLTFLPLLCVALVAGDLGAQTITRGPYLQVGTASSVTIRWRTDVASSGRVRYGTDSTSLANFIDAAGSTVDHTVTLSGLAPDTRYYYSVGTTAAVLASGTDLKFVTAPPAGASKPMRIWVIGDAGTGTASQTAVRDAYTAWNGARETDFWLVLGDNAYSSGTDLEYQTKHFAVYPSLLKSAVSWYTLGNHDAGTGSTGAHPYYTMFSFPTAGEAGGVASTTKAYYSFNYGNVHFISLDSQETNRSATGAMAAWLTADLQQNTLPWVIAFWHHPPYSKGSHDSDTEINLVEMRANMLPILEQYGVDLVLAGHSHVYERSYLLDGHYGLSTTLQPSMIKNGGSGNPSGSGAYGKPSTGPAAHEGAVYAVAGSSGQTSGFIGTHPAMYVSLNNLGSMVLDLDGDRLDASFLRENGTIVDTFRLVKGTVSGNLPPDASITGPATGSTFPAGAPITLSANAADEGSISQVAFYAGPTLLGTTATSPYSVTWNNAPAGAHRLTARATDNGGLVHISAPVFISVAAGAPGAPTNLAAGTVTASAVPLTWTDNATNETGYQVERAVGGGGFALLATLGANATSHTDTTVAAGTSYGYRVRAVNAAGNSSYSNTVNVGTPPSGLPSAPTGLTATAVSRSQIDLKWTDTSGNESGFRIERSSNGSGFTQIALTGPNATTYSSTGLTKNRNYSYRVRATNAAGDSAYSNTATAKTPK